MTDTLNWADGPLHAALVAALPAFVNEPFTTHPKLQVVKLGRAMERSHETIYKWLRANRLNPRAAREIIQVATARENSRVLKQLGRRLPAVEDFTAFLFA